MGIIDQLSEGITTGSSQDTQALAYALAEVMPADTTLALEGDLGSGKTTFVQGLAAGWGIEGPVTSPTYAIYSIYRGSRMLLHMDLYRLQSSRDADSLMIEDLLDPPWCIAVEWPEKLDAWWLQNPWTLTIKNLPDDRRYLRLRLP